MVSGLRGVRNEQGTDAEPDHTPKEGEFLQWIPL
jgi:hypothetical protein